MFRRQVLGGLACALALAWTAAGTDGDDTTTAAAPPAERLICEDGCFDTEDEMCFAGDLNYNQCMQIYGHREWKENACKCRMVSGEYVGGTSSSSGDGEVNIYFSIPAFVVLFRESLEVVLVLVIILQFLQKSKENGSINEDQHRKFRWEVYIGAGLGFLACICLGVGFLALIAFALKDVKGEAHLILEGILMIVTSGILSFMAINFYKMMYAKEAHERKMAARIAEALETAQLSASGQQAITFSKKHTFLMFAFMTGLREGLESILFLSAVVVDAKDLSSLPIPIVTAIISARFVGWCFFKGTNRMRVELFMKCSAVLLMFIAAGFFSLSMHNFQELDVFGTWSPKRERPWQNQEVFDASGCCNDKTNRFFVFMRAMLGWQDKPTPIEFFAWGLYWVFVVIAGYFVLQRAKRQLEDMQERWRQQDAEKAEAGAVEAKAADSPANGGFPATKLDDSPTRDSGNAASTGI